METCQGHSPIKANLSKFFPSYDQKAWSCSLCILKLEYSQHLFLGCDIARIVWRQSKWQLNIEAFVDFLISN
jgi:hypothetical protein